MNAPADEAALSRKALNHLQLVCDALWGRNYAPSWLTLQLNPDAVRRMGRFTISDDGHWMSLGGDGGEGGSGRDLIDLVSFVASVDRETAYAALRQLLANVEPAQPSPTRANVEYHEVTRPEPKVRSVPDRRSLRRG